MSGTIRFYDYRCFRRVKPATLHLRPGFTAFIGANNAGKSALIRSLYELRHSFSQLMLISADPNRIATSEFGFNISPPMYEAAEILCDREDPICEVELTPEPPFEKGELYIRSVRLVFSKAAASYRFKFYGPDERPIGLADGPTTFAAGGGAKIKTREGNYYDANSLLRFVRMLDGIQYIGPFRNALNEGAGNHYDSHIGTGFVAQWNAWKTGGSKVQNRAIEKVTEDVRRLVGANTLEISASQDGKTLHVVIDRRPHKLQELGSGIAQLIIVLGNALIRNPTFVVIDEPEIHLHPGLQLDFLTALASYATWGIVFATHSIGLARAAADYSFSVQRIDGASVVRPFERTPHYAEFLGSLGIAGLQEIGWDSVLLVEGPKDVRTFQRWLRILGKDRRTIVLPLGGDSLANGGTSEELSEIVRLGCRIFAVVDSERKAENEEPLKARRDFSAICVSLQIACCVTKRRAVENYLTTDSLERAFGKRYQGLSEYEEPGSNGKEFWGKGESWRAAQYMSRADLEGNDIGIFLLGI